MTSSWTSSIRSKRRATLAVYSILVVVVLAVSAIIFISVHRSILDHSNASKAQLVLKLQGDGCNWSSSDAVSIDPRHGWYCGASLTINNKSRRSIELNAKHQEAVTERSDVYYADFFLEELQHEKTFRIGPNSTRNLLIYFTLPRHVHPRFLVLRTLNPQSQFVVPFT